MFQLILEIPITRQRLPFSSSINYIIFNWPKPLSESSLVILSTYQIKRVSIVIWKHLKKMVQLHMSQGSRALFSNKTAIENRLIFLYKNELQAYKKMHFLKNTIPHGKVYVLTLFYRTTTSRPHIFFTSTKTLN